MSWRDGIIDYYDKALGGGPTFAVLGLALWITTVGLSFYAGHHEDAAYNVVGGLTALTGASVLIDFSGNKWITWLTVAAGSAALLISQSLWSDERDSFWRSLLLTIQVLAVGIQVGAIANTSGRGSLPG